MDLFASDPIEAASPERIVELATLARRARQLAGEHARRGLIERTLTNVAVTDRNRFADVDRRLMPDRLRVPPELVELLAFELSH